MDYQPSQIVCIAQAVWHESRGESDLGKRAVAHVIINRSKKSHKTPCEVLRQPGQFTIRLRKSYSGKDWTKAYQIASYPGRDPSGGALYFRSDRGTWKAHRLTTVIGRHRFYK